MQTENIESAINSVELKGTYRIPFSIYSKHNNKTTKLANLDLAPEARKMKGRSDWYALTFAEPAFVQYIEVKCSGYNGSYQDFEFELQSFSRQRTDTKRVSIKEDTIRCEVNDFISGFSFKPPSKLFGLQDIISVSAVGFIISDLSTFYDIFSKLHNLKADISEKASELRTNEVKSAQKVSELQASVDSLLEKRKSEESNLEALLEEVGKAEEQRASTRAAVSDAQANLTSLASKAQQQEETIEARKLEAREIASELSNKKVELKSLENDIYLFPSELKEFTTKGGKDKRQYWFLFAIPVLVLAALAYALLNNATHLATIFDENDNARVFSILITRLPYVVVATSIIGAMYAICMTLVKEIMRIDQQTRALAKISIIATDVSNSSQDGLGLSDEEKYHLRTGLKMDLLRDHLKNYISPDFSYSSLDRIKSRMSQIKERREKKGEERDDVDEV